MLNEYATSGRHRAGGGHDSLIAPVSLAALICFTPVAMLVAVVTMSAVIVQRRIGWWVVAVAGLAATVIRVLWNEYEGLGALGTHYAALGAGIRAMLRLDLSDVLASLTPTIPLGLSVGVMVGGLLVPLVTYSAGGAEWHPLEQRKAAIKKHRADRKAESRMADSIAQHRLPSPPLGVILDGNLKQWVSQRFVLLPRRNANLGMIVVGASGSGKTVTVQRLIMSLGSMGRKIVLVDCKGTDPDLADQAIGLYRSVHPGARVLRWPEQPLNMWEGSVTEVTNRLLQVVTFTEPYYEAVAQTVIRLALGVPSNPCRSSDDFLSRLDIDFLKTAYAGGERCGDIKSLIEDRKALVGVRLRYQGFFEALGGCFDGELSFGDGDIIVVTIPTLAAPTDAIGYVGVLLASFGHYCTKVKSRRRQDVSLIIDEFSAVCSTAPLVANLGERIRDVGGQVIVTAQSFQALGDDDDLRRRLVRASTGGLIVHQLQDPEELLMAAGTVRKAEHSWQLDSAGGSGMGSMRMGFSMAINPDEVRRARTGEAWVIANGRHAHMQVLPAPQTPGRAVRPSAPQAWSGPVQGSPRPETPNDVRDPFDE